MVKLQVTAASRALNDVRLAKAGQSWPRTGQRGPKEANGHGSAKAAANCILRTGHTAAGVARCVYTRLQLLHVAAFLLGRGGSEGRGKCNANANVECSNRRVD